MDNSLPVPKGEGDDKRQVVVLLSPPKCDTERSRRRVVQSRLTAAIRTTPGPARQAVRGVTDVVQESVQQ